MESQMETLGTAIAHYVKTQGSDPALHEVRRGEDGQVYVARWEHPFPQPTEGELEAAYLEARKAQKIAEIHNAAIDELTPLFTDEHGKDELIFLLAAHVKSIAGAQADPRLAEVERVGNKALAKRDEIEAASKEAELEAIEWT